MSMLGGIDLGGTKIEACLFDDEFNAVLRRRTATPTNSFEALLDALHDQYGWLRAQAGSTPLNVGFGIPALVEAETGLALTANPAFHGQAAAPGAFAPARL